MKLWKKMATAIATGTAASETGPRTAAANSLNSRGYRLFAGGWSGYVSHTDGSNTYFCDWQSKDLSTKARVDGIYLSSTKASWCA
ncbi:hypothetical protein [Streptomyces sp. NPDC096152]|uniref:hypothetical protein n=1 Tax=Streptomyces sp. NPDC096152 TaxID=3366078 RepID=UPI0038014094